MSKQKYIDWLTNWFANDMVLPSDYLNRNFFNEAWLNSFKTIELISKLETEFNLIFSDTYFSDPRFSSINGLSEILFEMETNK